MSEETATEVKAGRGRPRPDATVERDKIVLAYLSEHGEQSRPEIVTGTGLKGNEVYLSLYRLSRSDPPAVVKRGSKWSIAQNDEPPAAA